MTFSKPAEGAADSGVAKGMDGPAVELADVTSDSPETHAHAPTVAEQHVGDGDTDGEPESVSEEDDRGSDFADAATTSPQMAASELSVTDAASSRTGTPPLPQVASAPVVSRPDDLERQARRDAEICAIQMVIEAEIIRLEREHELRVNALRTEWRRLQTTLDERVSVANEPPPPPAVSTRAKSAGNTPTLAVIDEVFVSVDWLAACVGSAFVFSSASVSHSNPDPCRRSRQMRLISRIR